MSSLIGKVCIITGATRGIGRDMALTLARKGVNLVIAGKSTNNRPDIPGTIYSVRDEVIEEAKKYNHFIKVYACKCNVLEEYEVRNMVANTFVQFGRIDFLINNASALWWKEMEDTPMKKYDLINGVNARGSFLCTKYVLPHIKKQSGHIIIMSPPIDLDMIPGKIAYSISKFGMTMITYGLGRELKGTGIACNSLWPATMIESYATKNFKLGERRHWRKASIISDCVVNILQEDPNTFTGNALIDEDYLKSKGITEFEKYNCVEDGEPIRIIGGSDSQWNISVGHVKDGKNQVNIRSNL